MHVGVHTHVTLYAHRHTHIREVELCRLDNRDFKQFLPHIYQVLYDPQKVRPPSNIVHDATPPWILQEIHAILMEYLDKSNVCLLDCADDITDWRMEDIKVSESY